jgi:hypothetical protein
MIEATVFQASNDVEVRLPFRMIVHSGFLKVPNGAWIRVWAGTCPRARVSRT